jgi:hypothetical protein
MSEEERNAMRERFRNMSEEERQKFREEMMSRFRNMSEEDRARMRQRMGTRARLNPEEQLKAVAAMEKQLAKLKASITASAGGMPPNYRDLSEEERLKVREKLGKSRADRDAAVAAIRVELDKISPMRAMTQQMSSIRDLRAISALAEKEKAAETKKAVDGLIERQTRQFGPGRTPGRRPGAGEEGTRRGPREGGTRRPAREGAESDAPRRPSRGDSDAPRRPRPGDGDRE